MAPMPRSSGCHGEMRNARVPWQLRIYFLTSIFLSPPIVLHLFYRRIFGREANLSQRLGLPDPAKKLELKRSQTARPTVWVHGASVGESLSALTLVRLLHAKDESFNYVITSGSAAGQQILQHRVEADSDLKRAVVPQAAPIDVPFSVMWFLSQWNPSVFIVLEAEFWPNTLWLCSILGVRMILVDARMSERSAQRWSSWPARPLMEFLLQRFRLILCQSLDNLNRLKRLGAPNPKLLGSIKVAAGALPVDQERLERIRASVMLASGRERLVWAASSTHDGEEELATSSHLQLLQHWEREGLHSHAPPPLLAIIPRHVERGRLIADRMSRQHPEWKVSLSSVDGDDALATGVDVVVVDEMGVLGLWFSMAGMAFVGGSLVDGIGGHNVAEPAWLGCLPLHGPYYTNSEHMVRALRELESEGLVEVANSTELAAVLRRLLPQAARLRGGPAKTELEERQEAALRGVRALAARSAAPIVEGVHAAILSR